MRIEFPGAIYHVMSRGDRREAVFLDDVDRQDFIKTLAEECQKTGWQVHGRSCGAVGVAEGRSLSGKCSNGWKENWVSIMRGACIGRELTYGPRRL